jgi:tetratricopeptide (TPR) repeat protein
VSATPGAARLPVLPWQDRDEGQRVRPTPQPRSERDAALLRGLARRIKQDDPNAHNNLGVVYYHKGLFDDAVEQFERALELDPRMEVAERNLRIVYFGTGYFERFVADARAALERNADDVATRERLARACYHAGDAEAAVREWRGVLMGRPRDPAVYLMLARAELRRGSPDAALAALRNAAALDASSARVHLLLGEVKYQQGRSAEARTPLEEALRLDPGLAAAHHLLAFVYGDLGLDDLAGAAAARAAELDPSLAKVEANLSLDSHSTARYEELVGERPAGPVVAEHAALAHYNLGIAFRQKALYDEALREFRLATEQGEDTQLVQQAQAELLLLRGDPDAVPLYEALTRQEADSPKLWNELGVSHHQRGDLGAAITAYRRGLGLDESYVLVLNNLAVAELHRGGAAEAERLLRRALAGERAMADVARNLALLLQRAGRRDEAIGTYRAALHADDTSAPAWAGLGAVLMESGHPRAARDALVKAVALDPALAEARYNLAFALSALGDYEGALRETRHALQESPYIPLPRYRLLIDLQYEEASVLAPELDVPEEVRGAEGIAAFAPEAGALDTVFAREGAGQEAAPTEGRTRLAAAQAALDRGDLDGTLREAFRLAQEGGGRVEALLLQGEAFLRRGAAGEAVDRFEGALAELAGGGAVAGRDGEGETALGRALLGAARSLLQLDRPREAVEAAERLTELFPGDVVALRTLAEGLTQVGDHGRAMIVLDEAVDAGPADPALLTQLGRAALEAGEVSRAERALRDALVRGGDAPAARTALARVLARRGDADGAAAEFRAALAVLPSYGEAALGLAEVECGRQRYREAIATLVDLLTVDPYHLAGLVRLGAVLEAAGMQGKARVAYRRVLDFDPGNPEAGAALERLLGVAVDAAP